MNKTEFLTLRQRVIDAGYGDEILWSESLKPCEDAETFFWEYTWVVLNAGMKNQIARLIFDRIRKALVSGQTAGSVFRNFRKALAIDQMWGSYEKRFAEYQDSREKLTFLDSLPFIGEITKYHLAKNLGIDMAKPDRHLKRIADKYIETPQSLCERLAKETGYRVSTVDLIIWRAANLGMV